MLCERACLIFSEFSLEINASLDLWMASKLLLTILLIGWRVRAGAFLFKTDGSFGFLSMASWYGENPCTLWSEFLALIHQDAAKLEWHCVSSRTLFNMPTGTRLCLSTSLLLHGASAIVVLTVIPKDSAISMNFALANFPPLLVKNFSGAP